jgi:hypothetical protein
MNKITKLDQIMKLLKGAKRSTKEYSETFGDIYLATDLFKWIDGPVFIGGVDYYEVSFSGVIDGLLEKLEEEKKRHLVVEEI